MTLKKVIATSAIFAVASSSLIFSTLKTSAAGVASTVSPSTSTVSSTGAILLEYTTPTALPASSSFVVSYDSGYTGTASVQIEGVAVTGLTATTASGRTTLNMTMPNAILANESIQIDVTGLTKPSSMGNYSWSMRDTVNYSTVLQYVGEANVVNVRAFVPVTMSFVIRDGNDTANKNVCDLGDQSLTSHSNCDYRLRVATNAKNGYSIAYTASGDLNDGAGSPHNVANAAVGTSGTGGTAITNGTAGTEMYGVTIEKGETTVGGSTSTSLPSAFDAGSTNAVKFNDTASTVIMSSTKGNNPNPSSQDTVNTVKVTHKMNINATTPSGFYTAKYTYTVTPSF